MKLKSSCNPKCLNDNVFSILWFGMLAVLIFQHRAVFIHFDDFGYASLSYGYIGNQHGMNWTFTDLLSFLKWHYLNWGGRCLYYGIYVIALKIGENFIQLFQAIIIWGICIATYCMVKRHDKDVIATFLVIILYCSIGLGAASDGLFWYAASAGYVWPFLSLFFGLIVLKNKLDSTKKRILAPVLLFLAGFSQEQVAMLVIILVIVCFCVDFINKDINKYKTITYIFGITGALFEILAPGNFCRSGENADFYKLSIIKKIQMNIPTILKTNLDISSFVLVIEIIIVLLVIGMCIYKENKHLIIIEIGNIILSIGLILVMGMQYTNVIVVVIRMLFVCAFSAEIIWYLIKSNKINYLALFVGGVCSQGMMIMSPYMGYRSTLPFQFVIHIIIIDIFVSILSKQKLVIYLACILCISTLAIINVTYITTGYYQNRQINIINRSKLYEKSSLIKAGTKINSIILYRLADDRFASQMPYQQDFISVWVKNYFEIPQETIFIWQDLDKVGNCYELVEATEPQISSVWPETVNKDFKRTEDGGINFAVIPQVIDKNLVIMANGNELKTTIDNGFISAHLSGKELSDINIIEIMIKDKVTGKISEAKNIKVE